jgi:hypothetical protein
VPTKPAPPVITTFIKTPHVTLRVQFYGLELLN